MLRYQVRCKGCGTFATTSSCECRPSENWFCAVQEIVAAFARVLGPDAISPISSAPTSAILPMSVNEDPRPSTFATSFPSDLRGPNSLTESTPQTGGKSPVEGAVP